MVAVGPHSWNSSITAVDGDAVTMRVRAKWENYRDNNGLWLPIQSTWQEGSNGEYEHTASNWTLIAPATASGRIATYQENDWDIFSGAAFTLARTPALELEHVNASGLVDAYFDPAKPYEVRYPDAFGAGCSLVLRTWHARAMRPEHIIEITQLPANGADVEIVERVYTTLRIPGWDGSEVDIGSTGAGLYVPSDTVGMGMRPAVAWWRDSSGVLQTRSISVIAKRETGYVTLRKIIPYAVLVEAFASGATLVSADETLTLYPDPDTEVNTWDGTLAVAGSSTWATWMAASSGTSGYCSDNVNAITAYGYQSRTAGNTDKWSFIARSVYGFDTRSIGSGNTVTAATFGVWCTSKTNTNSFDATIIACSVTPASNTGFTLSDWAAFVKTKWSDTTFTSTSLATGAYNVFTLNATGLAGVGTTARTWLSIMSEADRSNTAPTWVASKVTDATVYGSEQTGLTNDPYLSVTWSASGGSIGADGRSFPRGAGRGIMRGCA